MSFELWIGEKFEHPHERVALSRLVHQMLARFGKQDDPYLMLAGFLLNDQDIDLTILAPQAIIVIELKDLRDAQSIIEGYENGDWSCKPVDRDPWTINEGRSNPYQQVRKYRIAWRKWLKNHSMALSLRWASSVHLKHIQGWVVFTPGFDREQSTLKLPKAVKILTLDEAGRQVGCEVTHAIQLTWEDMRAIAQGLGLKERPLDEFIDPGEEYVPPKIDPARLFRPRPAKSQLVGRDEDVALLKTWMKDAGLAIVAISGPDGIDKMQVAAALSRAIDERCEIRWVYCGETHDLTLDRLLAALADEIPDRQDARFVRTSNAERITARVAGALNYMETHRITLFLSDYHLVEKKSGIYQLLEQLAERSYTQAKVVLTTNRRPEIAHLQRYAEHELAGLAPQYVAAYMEQKGISLDQRQVQLLCEKSGGIPEALRMFAENTRYRPVQELLEEEVVEWTESLLEKLDKDARGLFKAAAIVRGPMSSKMMFKVWDKQKKQELIKELMDHYMLYLDSETGLYFTNKWLAAYAYQSTAEHVRRAQHRRAAEWLWEQAKQESDLQRQVELSIEAMYHAAYAQNWKRVLWVAQNVFEPLAQWNDWRRGRQVCQDALRASTEMKKNKDEALWQIRLARQLRKLIDLEGAYLAAERGLELAEKSGSKELMEKAHYQLGRIAYRKHDYEKAHAHFEQDLALTRELDNRIYQVAALVALGDVARRRGQLAEAEKFYQSGLELAQEANDQSMLSRVLRQYATLLRKQGKLSDAYSRYQQALEAAREQGDRYAVGMVLAQLADIDRQRGRFMDALDRYGEALKVARAMGDRRGEAIDLMRIGNVALNMDSFDKAASYYQQSADLCQRFGLDYTLVFNLGGLGRVAYWKGDYERACSLYRQAIKACGVIVDERGVKISKGNLADAFIAMGRLNEAEGLCDEIERSVSYKGTLDRAFMAKRRGLIALARGQTVEGKTLVDRAREQFKSAGALIYINELEKNLKRLGCRL